MPHTVPQKPITKPIWLTYARRVKSLNRSVRIATHNQPVEGESNEVHLRLVESVSAPISRV